MNKNEIKEILSEVFTTSENCEIEGNITDALFAIACALDDIAKAIKNS